MNTLSGREIKNWPLDRFVAACRWIAGEAGGTVVLLGGPGDARNAELIVRRLGGTGVRNLVGRLRLDESFALLRHVDLYLGNDSGLTHAAAMSGVPVVAIFSGIDPVANWMPLGPDVTVVRAEIDCSPCHLTHVTDCPNRHACIQSIGVEPVLDAVRRALDDAARGRPAAAHAPGG